MNNDYSSRRMNIPNAFHSNLSRGAVAFSAPPINSRVLAPAAPINKPKKANVEPPSFILPPSPSVEIPMMLDSNNHRNSDIFSHGVVSSKLPINNSSSASYDIQPVSRSLRQRDEHLAQLLNSSVPNTTFNGDVEDDDDDIFMMSSSTHSSNNKHRRNKSANILSSSPIISMLQMSSSRNKSLDLYPRPHLSNSSLTTTNRNTTTIKNRVEVNHHDNQKLEDDVDVELQFSMSFGDHDTTSELNNDLQNLTLYRK